MRYVLMLIPVAVQLLAIYEAALTRKPNFMPRYAWVLFTLTIPVISAALWFVLGRVRSAAPTRESGPDDDAKFLGSL